MLIRCLGNCWWESVAQRCFVSGSCLLSTLDKGFTALTRSPLADTWVSVTYYCVRPASQPPQHSPSHLTREYITLETGQRYAVVARTPGIKDLRSEIMLSILFRYWCGQFHFPRSIIKCFTKAGTIIKLSRNIISLFKLSTGHFHSPW